MRLLSAILLTVLFALTAAGVISAVIILQRMLT
jgi:hypothetical protein